MRRFLRPLAFLGFILAAVSVSAQTSSRSKTGSLDSATSVVMNVGDLGMASIDIRGTYTGTITFEVSTDGDNFVTVDCFTPAAPGTAVNSTTSTGLWQCPVGGTRQVRARMSSYTSGTANVVMSGSGGGMSTVAAAGGGSFDGVLLDAAGGDSVADTANDALRVNIVAGAGSGGTALADDGDFTAGTTSATPVSGFYQSSPTACTDGDACALSITSDRKLNVSVAGTVTANLGATDNAVLDDIADGIAVTNAGTFATQVDGAALTALQLIDNLVVAEDAVAGSAFSGVGILAVRQDVPSDLAADGDFIPLTIDADGGLRVSIVAGAGSGGTALADDADFTAGTTSFTPGGGFYQSAVTACTDGDTCAFGITAQRTLKVTLFSAAGSEITVSADVTEDAAETAGVTGPMVLSVRRDTPASSAGTTGDNATFNTNAVGALYVAPGGAVVHYRTSAGSTEDEHEIKATAGILYSVLITNTNASARYIRCYNLTAANTTPGTSTVFWGAAIPGAATGAGFTYEFPSGLTFDTALTCAFTTGAADTDVAEVAANEIKATYTYR
jgi:hypothetical protein